jgi:hypothetical protein
MLEAALELESQLRGSLDAYQRPSPPKAKSLRRHPQQKSSDTNLSPHPSLGVPESMGKSDHASAATSENRKQSGHPHMASRRRPQNDDFSMQHPAQNLGSDDDDDMYGAGIRKGDIGIQCLPRHMKIEEHKGRSSEHVAHDKNTSDSSNKYSHGRKVQSPASSYKLWRYINSRMPDSDSG